MAGTILRPLRAKGHTERKVHAMNKTGRKPGNSDKENATGADGAFGAGEMRQAFDKKVENAQVLGADVAMTSFNVLRESAEAGLDQFKALAAARSMDEVVELQGSFLRNQMDVAVRRARDFQALSERAINELVRPLQDMFTAGLKHG